MPAPPKIPAGPRVKVPFPKVTVAVAGVLIVASAYYLIQLHAAQEALRAAKKLAEELEEIRRQLMKRLAAQAKKLLTRLGTKLAEKCARERLQKKRKKRNFNNCTRETITDFIECAIDFIRFNKIRGMVTYADLRSDRRRCLALTGLTPAEFDLLLPVFDRYCERLYFAKRTLAGRLRRRFPGGGRTGKLDEPQQKLLFLLVYLKTYPLQVLMAELFGMSQPRVNYWLRRLLPVLREALDELGALPERDPRAFARAQAPRRRPVRRIIDACERRRQRPKNPEKQAAHYSGRKKTHCDKNVVVATAASRRIEYLSPTYAGRVADKRIADREGIAYPPGTVLYKDSGFQGYEPPVAKTYQAKKKAARRGADVGPKAHQPQTGPDPRARRARPGRREALPDRQGRVAQHQ